MNTEDQQEQLAGYMTQKQRLLALVLNIALLLTLGRMVTGEFISADSGKRLWFLSGLGLFFLTLLSAPWFRAPRNALVNAVTSALLLSLLDLTTVNLLNGALVVFRFATVSVMAATAICALCAMVFVDADPVRHPVRKHIALLGYRISNLLGRGELVFTPAALISIIGFYQQSLEQQLWLLFGWVFLISVRPVELVIRLVEETHRVSRTTVCSRLIGTISRVDNPGIVRVALEATADWATNSVAVACLPNETVVNVLCLFSHTEESRLVGTGLCHDTLRMSPGELTPCHVYRKADQGDAARIVKELSGMDTGAQMVGFVVEDSNIGILKFEAAPGAPIEEGTLVFCQERGQNVFYQVFDARSTEESFDSNPRGKHVVSAAQLGCLHEQKGFAKFGWLPAMNLPVFVCQASVQFDMPTPKDDEFVIGTIPGSKINVRAGCLDLIEYHTAILGATGTGKTELAFDVIRKALSLGVKVFCVDFTNEYKARLASSSPQLLGLSQTQAEDLDQKLFAVETGTYGAPKEKEALKKFTDEIRAPVKKCVEEFLSAEGAGLGIFELPEITNTKATLRATELYLSSIMEWARKNRRARRILVVLEEAHTIIPEIGWAGFDHETQWVVGRISQIALQGRKYGVGLLLVSQRTALVSKSVLSQCNTCVAFSMVDKTSLDYLANVYSAVHVQSIPNLRFLEAVAYGKGIRSERPVVVQLRYDQAKKDASDALTVVSHSAT